MPLSASDAFNQKAAERHHAVCAALFTKACDFSFCMLRSANSISLSLSPSMQQRSHPSISARPGFLSFLHGIDADCITVRCDGVHNALTLAHRQCDSKLLFLSSLRPRPAADLYTLFFSHLCLCLMASVRQRRMHSRGGHTWLAWPKIIQPREQ